MPDARGPPARGRTRVKAAAVVADILKREGVQFLIGRRGRLTSSNSGLTQHPFRQILACAERPACHPT
jgi:hypothetical protein